MNVYVDTHLRRIWIASDLHMHVYVNGVSSFMRVRNVLYVGAY